MKSKREEMLDVVSHMDVVLPLMMLFQYILVECLCIATGKTSHDIQPHK